VERLFDAPLAEHRGDLHFKRGCREKSHARRSRLANSAPQRAGCIAGVGWSGPGARMSALTTTMTVPMSWRKVPA
jgi:hypothetical protein